MIVGDRLGLSVASFLTGYTLVGCSAFLALIFTVSQGNFLSIMLGADVSVSK